MFKKFSIKNILIALGILSAGTVGTVYYTSTSNQSREAATTTVKPKIEVTTTSAQNKLIVGSNLVDLVVEGGGSRKKEKNLLDTNFLRLQGALRFDRFVYPSVGSISQYSHFVGITGTSYNFREQDFATYEDYISYGNNVCCGYKTDFATYTKQFTNAINTPCDVVLNIKNGNWNEHKNFIEYFDPEYVWLQAESVTDKGFGIDKYLSLAVPVRDSIKKYFPNVKIVPDCGLSYRMNQRTLDWNKKIYPPFQNEYGGRIYIQVADQVTFTSNQDSNIIRTNLFCDSIISENLKSFKKQFPNWKALCGELLIENNRTEDGNEKRLYITGTITGIFTWARLFETLVEKQDSVPLAYQMSDKNLVSNDTSDITYKAFKLLLSFLKSGKSINTISFTEMPGVTGVGLSIENTYTFLINNGSYVPYTLENIKYNGITTNKKMQFVAESQYSDSWNGDVKYSKVTSTGTYTIPSNGFTVLTFTKQ